MTKWTGPAIVIKVHRNTLEGDPTYVEVVNFKPNEHTGDQAVVQKAAICDIKPFYFRVNDDRYLVQQGIEELDLRDDFRQHQVYIPRDLCLGYESDDPLNPQQSPQASPQAEQAPAENDVNATYERSITPEHVRNFMFNDPDMSSPINEPSSASAHNDYMINDMSFDVVCHDSNLAVDNNNNTFNVSQDSKSEVNDLHEEHSTFDFVPETPLRRRDKPSMIPVHTFRLSRRPDQVESPNKSFEFESRRGSTPNKTAPVSNPKPGSLDKTFNISRSRRGNTFIRATNVARELGNNSRKENLLPVRRESRNQSAKLDDF